MAIRNNIIRLALTAFLFSSCVQEAKIWDSETLMNQGQYGKSDGPEDGRLWTTVLTQPHCDICNSDDKNYLKARSAITAKVVQLIDNASSKIDVAQFTFSVHEIEQALIRAHQRNVTVRVAMNGQQALDNSNVAHRLLDAGLNVRFIDGRSVPNADYSGLMHAKFMLVDDNSLAMGSNNWSSTGTSINEENTLLVEATRGDHLLKAFACHFKAIWSADHEASVRCSTDEVAFTPGTKALTMLKQGIRNSTRRVDVLMHHLLFDDLVKELAKAAERGVQVRVIVNNGDQAELNGSAWTRFHQAGGRIRFKQRNADMYQLMHHKLAIVDGEILYNGSGNWSGSAFFNNFEFFTKITRRHVVNDFNALYSRLWMWSLNTDSLNTGRDAAQQHAEQTQVFFGNLHAHFEAAAPGQLLDDGKLERMDEHGHPVDFSTDMSHGDPARYAYEYARDQGKMDFMALTPHCVDDESGQANHPNMDLAGYDHIIALSEQVTDSSGGMFLAIPGMEWNTNSAGNHVTILGSKELSKVARGRFDLLYDEFLPRRSAAGDSIIMGMNHPRSFRKYTTTLNGNWDQVFGSNLSEIPSNSQRKNKFNDFGLDDYPPLNALHESWVTGQTLPDNTVVYQTLQNVRAAASPYARFMEVLVGRGKELNSEVPTNPSLFERDPTEEGGPVEIERFTRVHHDWDYYLLNGFELAPTAPHDNHFANWGTGHSSRTGIIAKSLSEEHIFGAMDDRAMYATEDQNTEIRVYANGRVPMGDSMSTIQSKVTLSVLARDPDSMNLYDVSIYQGSVGGSEVRVSQTLSINSDQWTDIEIDCSGGGRHFVYLQFHNSSENKMSWSAPIWINSLSQ